MGPPFPSGVPLVGLMLRSLPLQLLPMLPLGHPLMTLMPSLIPYRILMIMMTPMTVCLTMTSLFSTFRHRLLPWICLARNTAVWWSTFAVSFRKQLRFHWWILCLGLYSSPSFCLLLTLSHHWLSIGLRGCNRL